MKPEDVGCGVWMNMLSDATPAPNKQREEEKKENDKMLEEVEQQRISKILQLHPSPYRVTHIF